MKKAIMFLALMMLIYINSFALEFDQVTRGYVKIYDDDGNYIANASRGEDSRGVSWGFTLSGNHQDIGWWDASNREVYIRWAPFDLRTMNDHSEFIGMANSLEEAFEEIYKVSNSLRKIRVY